MNLSTQKTSYDYRVRGRKAAGVVVKVFQKGYLLHERARSAGFGSRLPEKSENLRKF